MNEEQRAAYVNSQVACALIESAGMQAANAVAAKFNAPLPFNKDAFDDLIHKYGIHHNSVLEALR